MKQATQTYWLVDADSGQATELATRPSFAMEHVAKEMTWSPTGRYLLVRNEIFDLSGKLLVSEFPGGATWIPIVSPLSAYGQDMLLVNGRDGMVVMQINGEEVMRITDVFVDAWQMSHNGRYIAYLNPQQQNDLVIFDFQNQESVHLDPDPVDRPLLYWSGNDACLLLDDGRRNSPIWTLSIEPGSQVQEILVVVDRILEEGALIDAITMPDIVDPD